MKSASLILQVALAFSLLYPAISGFILPLNWVGYFPPYILDIFSGTSLLTAFGVFEIILAVWVLSGWKIIYSSSVAFVVLVLIILLNLPQFAVLFRDVPIALAALALITLHRAHTE